LELNSAGGPPGTGLDTRGLSAIHQDSMLNVYYFFVVVKAENVILKSDLNTL